MPLGPLRTETSYVMPPSPPFSCGARASPFQRERLDERGGGPVSTFDASVHEADEVASGVLSGELHPAAKGGLGGDVQHRGILSDLGAGVASEREGIVGPEE